MKLSFFFLFGTCFSRLVVAGGYETACDRFLERGSTFCFVFRFSSCSGPGKGGGRGRNVPLCLSHHVAFISPSPVFYIMGVLGNGFSSDEGVPVMTFPAAMSVVARPRWVGAGDGERGALHARCVS